MQHRGGYGSSASPTCDTTFTEIYAYTFGLPAPTGKQLTVTRSFWNGYSYVPSSVNLAAAYTYDMEGRTINETYPTDHNGSTANLSYTFDQHGPVERHDRQHRQPDRRVERDVRPRQ